MLINLPSLRIEKELPTQLTLVSPNRRWLTLLLAFMMAFPIFFLGLLTIFGMDEMLFGMAILFAGSIFLATMLVFFQIRNQLLIDFNTRTLTFGQFFWLGFGALERYREQAWMSQEITDIAIRTQGLTTQITIKINGKKKFRLNFMNRLYDAQRTYDRLQSWQKGLMPDSGLTTAALKESVDKNQSQQALKSAEKLLYYFGIFSLLSAGMGLLTELSISSSVSTTTIIEILTGLAYLACAYGAKKRSEIALWVAILIVVAERLYWFIRSQAINSGWSSWLTWIFAVIIVSSLWQAIRNIRTMKKDPVYEPLA